MDFGLSHYDEQFKCVLKSLRVQQWQGARTNRLIMLLKETEELSNSIVLEGFGLMGNTFLQSKSFACDVFHGS